MLSLYNTLSNRHVTVYVETDGRTAMSHGHSARQRKRPACQYQPAHAYQQRPYRRVGADGSSDLPPSLDTTTTTGMLTEHYTIRLSWGSTTSVFPLPYSLENAFNIFCMK
jgi:hypothetical protein